jgi:hypothetical protein
MYVFTYTCSLFLIGVRVKQTQEIQRGDSFFLKLEIAIKLAYFELKITRVNDQCTFHCVLIFLEHLKTIEYV